MSDIDLDRVRQVQAEMIRVMESQGISPKFMVLVLNGLINAIDAANTEFFGKKAADVMYKCITMRHDSSQPDTTLAAIYGDVSKN